MVSASVHFSPAIVAGAPRHALKRTHGLGDTEERAGMRRSADGASSRRAGKPGKACPACKRSRDRVALQGVVARLKWLEGVRSFTASVSASAAGGQ